jgi:DNA-binding response OmpR family regulator
MTNESPMLPVVLVVDDEPRNLQLVGKLLSDGVACDLCFAGSGREALETMESVKPDLVLLDVNMPEMNGYELCRALRGADEYREIPVIFLTAQREPEDMVRGFEAGGTDYVGKPFESRELLARVRVQLELKRSRDELKQQKDELEATLARIRRLEGIISICSYCKKIRNEENSWEQLEVYITEHSEALFSHGVCPACKDLQLSYLKR